MEDLENLAMSALEGCTYRDLQRYAKSIGLPSNVKKNCLIEMIHAKKYSSSEHFDSVVARVRDQRKQASKPRKNAKRKKRVQGNEITSTSSQPPPISTTPQPPYAHTDMESSPHTIMQCRTSILNPLITKRALNTDRVLRSYNNKLKRNMKYSILNINNTVMNVIKAQNTVKSMMQERVCEWNTEVQRFRPVRAVLQRTKRLSIESEDLVLHPIAESSNQQAVCHDSEDRQLVHVRDVKPVPRSQRRVSGVYPLKPTKQIQHKSSYITYRNHDGRICKLNTFIQRQTPINRVQDKIIQTAAQRNLKPVVVSRRDAIRMPEITTLQDILNYQVNGSFSTSSTETAEDSSNDRLEQSTYIPESSRGTASSMSVVKKKPGPKCYTRLMQKKLMENRAKMEPITKMTGNVEKTCVLETDEHVDISVQNPRNREKRDSSIQCTLITYSAKMGADKVRTCVQNPISEGKPGLAVENCNQQSNHSPCVVQNQTRQNNHGSYAAENQNRQRYIPYGIDNQNNQTHNQNILHSRQNQNNNYAMENQKNYGLYAAKTQNHYTKETYKDLYTNTEEQNSGKFNRNQRNLHIYESTQYMEYNNENRKDILVKNAQNSMRNLHTDAVRDYPNMSRLSDVYAESEVTVTQAMNGEYYHKKIRAEQVRAKRLSQCIESVEVCGTGSTLPHIAAVFSQMGALQYRDLTRPLYVHTGTHTSALSSCPELERLYNYRGALAPPLSEHHVLRSTAQTNTNTVYCTPLFATAAPHESAPLRAHCRDTTYARASELSARIEPEQVPRLQDYLRAAHHETDITCDEVVQQSPVSSRSACSAAALSTETYEDVLDIISQDGDYMERISMEERAQCFLCAWAGPRYILDYHVRMSHAGEILVSESPAWSHSVALGAARDGVRLVTEHAGQLYVLSALCRTNTSLHADLTMVPKDNEPELPVYGRLTIYNKVTGEPFTWEGEISCPPLIKEENEVNHTSPDQNGSQVINHDQTRSELINPYQTESLLINCDQTRSELINPYKTESQLIILGQTRSELNSNHEEPNKQNMTELKRLLSSSTQSSPTNDMKDRNLNQNGPNKHNLEQKRSESVKPVRLETNDLGQEILNLDEPNVLHLGQTRSDGLNIALTSLDLLPNSANLMLVNGEWVLKSAAKVVAGQPTLDNIDVVIYVQILE